MFGNNKIAAAGLLAILLSAPAPAGAQNLQRQVPMEWVDRLGECQSEERSGADRIAKCSEIIAAPQVNAEMRAEAYFNRASVHMSEGRSGPAIADLTHAIELNADFSILYAYRAEAYAADGDLDRALADLDKAIALDADNADFLASRGRVHVRRKDLTKAIADFRAALVLDADHIPASDGLRELGEK